MYVCIHNVVQIVLVSCTETHCLSCTEIVLVVLRRLQYSSTTYVRMYNCVLLCSTVYYCVLLCTTVYYCVLLCTTVDYCGLLWTTVYYCVLPCTTMYYCGLL